MSYPRYPKYKDSGVEWLGEVPAHWTVRRLGFYFDERREKVSDKEFTALSVTRAGIVPQLETAAKTDDGDNRKLVRAGDFVINSRSDRKGSAGVADCDGSVSLISTVLVPRAEVKASFVHHLLRSQPFQEEYYRFGKGIVADLWSTGYSEMRNITLAVPPILEQVQISKFLGSRVGHVDSLILEQQQLIELLKEKRQASISHAVTKGVNPKAATKSVEVGWVQRIPSHWSLLAFRRVITHIEQGWSPECDNRPAEPGEWGVLKAGCVNRGTLNERENKSLPQALFPVPEYEIRAGDVLMSRANGSPELVGSTAYVSRVRARLMLSDKIFRIHLENFVNPRYFALACSSAMVRWQIERSISGADGLANNLPQAALLAFNFFLPPLVEQLEIARYVETEVLSVNRLIEEALRAIELLQERRTALISAAVTGKIDVRNLTSPSESLAAAAP